MSVSSAEDWLTRMLLQVLVMAEQVGEEGKSSGRAGRESSRSSGARPPWPRNSRMWSSVELLVRMALMK